MNGRSQRDSTPVTGGVRWSPLTRSVCSVCSSARRRRTGLLLQSTNATLKHDLLSHAFTPSVPGYAQRLFSTARETATQHTLSQKCNYLHVRDNWRSRDPTGGKFKDFTSCSLITKARFYMLKEERRNLRVSHLTGCLQSGQGKIESPTQRAWTIFSATQVTA